MIRLYDIYRIGTLMKMRDFWLQAIKRPLVLDTINITILRVFARSIGALIPFFIAAWFGISSQTDAFFFVYGVVIFFTNIFSSVLESFIVPFIAEFRSKNQGDVKLFIFDILVSSAVIISILSLTCLIFLRPLLSVSTKFSPETIKLVFWLFIEIMPLLLFTTLSGVLSGALNAHKDFRLPAVSPGFRAGIALVVIFSTKDIIGVHSIPLGYIMGEVVRLVILFKSTFRDRLIMPRLSFVLARNVVEFFKISLYRTVGMLAIAFTPIIDRIMASWLGSGAITIIDYADKIYSIPVVLIVEGFLVAALSHWSTMQYNEYQQGQLKKEAVKTCKTIFVVAVVVAVSLFLAKDFVTKLIYGGRKIGPEQLSLIENILGYYLLGFVPLVLVMTLGNVYVILKKARFLMMVGFVIIIGRVILNLIFMRVMGMEGIALSASIVQFIVLAIYWKYLERV